MIDSLHIKNCQSHKDTFIQFHNGVNVFVGDTDAGKSAIMRSLRYVIWNKSSSKNIVSNWGGPLSVTIVVDGNSITRSSDKKELYKLNDLDFKSFGIKVPVEIERVINMEEINIQEQIDNFFLLTETPGYVASYLNKIANLEQIDSTTKHIKSKLNKKNRLIEFQKEVVIKKGLELETFNYLSELEKEINSASLLEEKTFELQLEVDSIYYLLKSLKSLNEELENTKKIIKAKKIVISTIDLISDKTEVENSIAQIDLLNTYAANFDAAINELTKLLDLKKTVKDALKLTTEQNDLDAKLNDIELLHSKIISINKKIEISNVEMLKERTIYETELHKLNKCFFCGQKLKNK